MADTYLQVSGGGGGGGGGEEEEGKNSTRNIAKQKHRAYGKREIQVYVFLKKIVHSLR